MVEPRVDAYAELAAEYYDRTRHPTCANFRNGSIWILEQWLTEAWPASGWICETGAGRSVVSEVAARRGLDRGKLILLDSVPAMLEPTDDQSHFLIADALKLPFCDNALELLVSSLGDPYNVPDFWSEATRVLKPGGSVLFTTPSMPWSLAFRADEDDMRQSAEFELIGGRVVSVPSFILSEEDQSALMRSSGVLIDDIRSATASELDASRLSPKLECVGQGPIVTGYRGTVS